MAEIGCSYGSEWHLLRRLGLEHDYPLSDRVHKLFLPVIEAS